MKIKELNSAAIIWIMSVILFAGCVSDINYHFQTGGRKVITGLENFINGGIKEYEDKKTALVTNQSGFDFNLKRNIQLLRAGGIRISLLLAPEHGLYGYFRDTEYPYYRYDRTFNLPVYNLFYLDKNTLKALLGSVDIVIFDIQDMGMRCYTYITNLKEIIDALQGLKTELIVLDRPDPIGFLGVDGANLEPAVTTRPVSAFPAPLLYGMTIGESARYYRGEFAPNIRLTVIRMSGYRRCMTFNQTGLPWIPPSPNLPTYESSIIYSMAVLMEGINISLGRGTVKPFEYLGAPWIEPISFCRMLNNLKIKNFRFRPAYFKPLYGKYAGAPCGGAQIFYIGGRFSPTEVSYRIISTIMKNYSYTRWEISNYRFSIDALAGTDKFRRAIQEGKKYGDYHSLISPAVKKFMKKREKYLMY
jgi:uncharacterized protein YbbC (DUF1343 family)